MYCLCDKTLKISQNLFLKKKYFLGGVEFALLFLFSALRKCLLVASATIKQKFMVILFIYLFTDLCS